MGWVVGMDRGATAFGVLFFGGRAGADGGNARLKGISIRVISTPDHWLQSQKSWDLGMGRGGFKARDAWLSMRTCSKCEKPTSKAKPLVCLYLPTIFSKAFQSSWTRHNVSQ